MDFCFYVQLTTISEARMLLYILIALVAFCVWWVQKRFKFWEERGFPSPPSTFPFGSLKGVGTKISNFELNDKIYKKFKGKTVAVGMFHFMSPALLPIDLELLKNIFIRDFATFQNRGFYYNKEDDPTSAKYAPILNWNLEFGLWTKKFSFNLQFVNP